MRGAGPTSNLKAKQANRKALCEAPLDRTQRGTLDSHQHAPGNGGKGKWAASAESLDLSGRTHSSFQTRGPRSGAPRLRLTAGRSGTGTQARRMGPERGGRGQRTRDPGAGSQHTGRGPGGSGWARTTKTSAANAGVLQPWPTQVSCSCGSEVLQLPENNMERGLPAARRWRRSFARRSLSHVTHKASKMESHMTPVKSEVGP